jgi:phytol kinase
VNRDGYVSTAAVETASKGIGAKRAGTAEDSGRWTVQALPYREIRRRLWHMAPGVLAFGLHAESHADPITPTLKAIIIGCGVLIAVRIFSGFRQIERQGEGKGTAAVAGYAFSVLLTMLLFPRHLEIGVGVLAILAFGDGSATLFGLTFRGPRLPWNSSKSWSGFLAFIGVGSLMSTWLYWGETWNPEAADPGVSFLQALLIVSPAVIASAFAESIRTRLNDNIRVGIVAAITLIATHFLMRTF